MIDEAFFSFLFSSEQFPHTPNGTETEGTTVSSEVPAYRGRPLHPY